MSIKPFHFEPVFEDESLVLLELYLQSSALVEALRGILADEGIATDWAAPLIKKWDRAVIKLIRHPAPPKIGPN